MNYEQEWARHQELLKTIERINEELVAAQAELNTVRSQELSQEGAQPNTGSLETKVERLREELTAAQTEVGKFQMEVAQNDPEHARWLEEGQPPQNEQKLNLADKAMEVVDALDEKIAELPSLILEPALDTMGFVGALADPMVQDLVDQTAEHLRVAAPYVAGAVLTEAKEVVEAAKDTLAFAGQAALDIAPTQPPPPEIVAQLQGITPEVAAKNEQILNEFYDNKNDILGNAGGPDRHDPGIPSPERGPNDSSDRSPDELPKVEAQVKWEKDIAQEEQKLRETHKMQMDALDRNKDILEKQKEGADETKLEQLKPMDELMKRQEDLLNKKLSESLDAVDQQKEALQQAVDSAQHLEGAEKNREIEKHRELERQREIERLREAEERDRNR